MCGIIKNDTTLFLTNLELINGGTKENCFRTLRIQDWECESFVAVCMLLAPIHIFSSIVRTEKNSNGAHIFQCFHGSSLNGNSFECFFFRVVDDCEVLPKFVSSHCIRLFFLDRVRLLSGMEGFFLLSLEFKLLGYT